MIYEDRIPSKAEKKAKKVAARSFLPKDVDTSILETIPYQYPENKITVRMETHEFTCLCPFSGLPDFAYLAITYVPRRKIIELKSLKLYLYAFRNIKVYNEHAVNKILLDLKKKLKPWEISIEAEFTARGGIKNKVTSSYSAKR